MTQRKITFVADLDDNDKVLDITVYFGDDPQPFSESEFLAGSTIRKLCNYAWDYFDEAHAQRKVLDRIVDIIENDKWLEDNL